MRLGSFQHTSGRSTTRTPEFLELDRSGCSFLLRDRYRELAAGTGSWRSRPDRRASGSARPGSRPALPPPAHRAACLDRGGTVGSSCPRPAIRAPGRDEVAARTGERVCCWVSAAKVKLPAVAFRDLPVDARSGSPGALNLGDPNPQVDLLGLRDLHPALTMEPGRAPTPQPPPPVGASAASAPVPVGHSGPDGVAARPRPPAAWLRDRPTAAHAGHHLARPADREQVGDAAGPLRRRKITPATIGSRRDGGSA